MQGKIISSSSRPLFLAIVVAAFICAQVTVAHAQSQAGPRQVTLAERENSAREGEATATTIKRDPKEVLAEVNEHMRQLNALNGAIATHAAATNQPLNYGSIIKNVAEIKERSSKLKTNLALPQKETKDKGVDLKSAEKGELQPGLAALNKLIDSFLQNPVFSSAGAVDMQLAAKARRDLEDIIVLSEKLRKNAEKRSKNNGNAQ